MKLSDMPQDGSFWPKKKTKNKNKKTKTNKKRKFGVRRFQVCYLQTNHLGLLKPFECPPVSQVTLKSSWLLFIGHNGL